MRLLLRQCFVIHLPSYVELVCRPLTAARVQMVTQFGVGSGSAFGFTSSNNTGVYANGTITGDYESGIGFYGNATLDYWVSLMLGESLEHGDFSSPSTYFTHASSPMKKILRSKAISRRDLYQLRRTFLYQQSVSLPG